MSAISVLSVFAAAAALWGTGAGLAAAGAYSVAPIRLDPMYWHGLGTSLALVFVPLVVLALGLMFRGQGGRRASGLLALSLVGVAAAHSTSIIVVGALIVLAPLVDAVRWLVVRRRPIDAARAWWREGIARPLAVGLVLAAVLGAGVAAHLAGQAADLGSPVDYRIFDPGWLDRAAIRGYFSWELLALGAVALGVVVASRGLRRDPALLAVGSLALACVVVNELWRVEFAFEYRRVVYYAGIVLVLLIGAAAVRMPRRVPWIAAYVLVLAFIAHVSVGLRLPQRVLSPEPDPASRPGLLRVSPSARQRRAARHAADRRRQLPEVRGSVLRAPTDDRRDHGARAGLREPAPARAPAPSASSRAGRRGAASRGAWASDT